MLLRTHQDIRAATQRWASLPLVALDTETTGLDPQHHRVLLVALSQGQDTLLCDVRALTPQAAADALAPVLDGPSIKVMHNARFDVRMLQGLGIHVEHCADTWLNELLLSNGAPDEGGHGLAELSRRHLGVHLSKDEQTGFVHMGSGQEFSASQVEYARRDVLATWHLLLHQVPRLQQANLQRIARLEARLVPALAAMEHHGIHVDQKGWLAATRHSADHMAQARALLDQHFARVCNVDLLGAVDINYESDLDVKDALERLGIKLETLSNDALRDANHPAALALLNYREAHKLVSTYGESFLATLNPHTGRIHASFRQLGASTGRLSCERPNLQNIPRDSALRACFVAPPGRALITADYAACELRILAHLSQDPVFLDAFEQGQDVHSQVASIVFGVAVSKTQHPQLRERAKAISFGLIYGMGAAGLAAQTGQSLPDAEQLLRTYFARFPRIDQALRTLESRARQQRAAHTVWGRRLLMDPAAWDRSAGAASRLARNMPIQGTSADITKLAMVFLHQRWRGSDIHLVNCVHDELLVECPAHLAQDTAALVQQDMERAMRAVIPQVPPKVDVSVGPTWAKG